MQSLETSAPSVTFFTCRCWSTTTRKGWMYEMYEIYEVYKYEMYEIYETYKMYEMYKIAFGYPQCSLPTMA